MPRAKKITATPTTPRPEGVITINSSDFLGFLAALKIYATPDATKRENIGFILRNIVSDHNLLAQENSTLKKHMKDQTIVHENKSQKRTKEHQDLEIRYTRLKAKYQRNQHLLKILEHTIEASKEMDD